MHDTRLRQTRTERDRRRRCTDWAAVGGAVAGGGADVPEALEVGDAEARELGVDAGHARVGIGAAGAQVQQRGQVRVAGLALQPQQRRVAKTPLLRHLRAAQQLSHPQL